MGLPSTGTFHTRPRVSGPTGIFMGSPVSTASRPRCRPSVEVMATQRATPPGSWLSTSRTVLMCPIGVSASTVSAL